MKTSHCTKFVLVLLTIARVQCLSSNRRDAPKTHTQPRTKGKLPSILASTRCTSNFSFPNVDHPHPMQNCQRYKRRRHVLHMNAQKVDTGELGVTPATTSQIRIRDAQYTDLPQIAELLVFGFYPELSNNPILRPLRVLLELDRIQSNFPYENREHSYLVASVANGEIYNGNSSSEKIVGFCDIDGRAPAEGFGRLAFLTPGAFVVRQRPYLSDLAVHPDYRRQGIARDLMAEAESRVCSMGFEELFLGVASTNEPALRMYSVMGYDSDFPSGDILKINGQQKSTKLLRRTLDSNKRISPG